MNRIIKGLGIALGCVLIASSCSEISFGDKFLGDQPESSGATTEEMFSSRSEERRVGKECLRLCRSRWSPYH